MILELISWSDYFLLSGAAMCAYYGCVGILFYRREIFQFVQHWQIEKGVAVTSDLIAPPTTDHLASGFYPDHPLMPRVHECVDEIQALLLQLSEEEPDEKTICSSVQRLLCKYQDLRHSPFQKSISELVASVSKSECGIGLTQTTIQRFWNKPDN